MYIFYSTLKSHELPNYASIHNIEKKHPQTIIKHNSSAFEEKLYPYEFEDFDSQDAKNVNVWLNQVLYAGLFKFKFRNTKFKVNIGLNLREYYRNINDYLSISKQKKLNYFIRGKELSKFLQIQDYCIYPNIYAQAIAFSRIINESEFILLKFGKDDFEGIYFDPTLNKEKQHYTLGPGVGEFLTDFNFEGPQNGGNLAENKQSKQIETKIKFQSNQYIKNQILRKINKLITLKPDASIVVVRDAAISPYVGDILASKIRSEKVKFVISEANSIASEGLYLIDEFESLDSSHTKVGVAISKGKSIFTSK